MKFNKFRWKEFENCYLLTTNDGSKLILEKHEFHNLLEENINEELYSKLEKSNIIITEKNLKNIEKNYIKRFHFLPYGPSLHIVVLSNRCTHKCSYCHAASLHSSKLEYDMSIETAKKVVQTILSTDSDYIMIEFQGGEPLINFEVLQFFVEEINKRKGNKKVKFGITTNLELMSEEILDYFNVNKVNICTSLDGDATVHNKYRKSEDSEFNSFENIRKWVNRIHNRNERINALVTVTRDSLSRHKEIIDTYVHMGFDQIFLRPLNNLGSAQSKYDLKYTAEEYFNFYQNSVKYIAELRKKGIDIIETYTSILIQKLENDYDPNLCELRNPAGDCTGVLTYNHDGKIYPRDEGRMEAADIDLFTVGYAGQTIDQIMQNKKVRNLIKSTINVNYDCDLCVYQPFCGLNPVSNYANFKSITPINIEDERCKLIKRQFDFILQNLNSNEKKIH